MSARDAQRATIQAQVEEVVSLTNEVASRSPECYLQSLSLPWWRVVVRRATCWILYHVAGWEQKPPTTALTGPLPLSWSTAVPLGCLGIVSFEIRWSFSYERFAHLGHAVCAAWLSEWPRIRFSCLSGFLQILCGCRRSETAPSEVANGLSAQWWRRNYLRCLCLIHSLAACAPPLTTHVQNSHQEAQEAFPFQASHFILLSCVAT